MGENDMNKFNSEIAAENVMAYMGSHGTWTPAHYDHCGAAGHNIMTHARGDRAHKTKAEAFWRALNQTPEYENYFARVEELSKADFPITVVKQSLGDLVVIPSLCFHQVINLGPASIKVAWNRLTTHCLKTAIEIVLPLYKDICKPETYRIKTVIAGALKSMTAILQGSDPPHLSLSAQSFMRSYRDLVDLYKSIVQDEWIDLSSLQKELWTNNNQSFYQENFSKPVRGAFSMLVTCDFCRCDIWNRHLHCDACKSEEGDGYDICLDCFSRGRGCDHRSTNMQMTESMSFKSARQLVVDAVESWNNSALLKSEKYVQYFMAISDDWKKE
ncbi:hypothetical protein EDD11_010053 [Mortierella claussenii]|nr:hypothetical protein EDD11_010053 [Mortierella claussenii]